MSSTTKNRFRTVALIPARGGSKRIPRKNIRLFHGQPMIAWAIAAAKESKVFDRIIVSTDDDEIADVSREHGAEIPFIRPAKISGDVAITDEVLMHALDWLEEENTLPEFLCCIYPAVPFLKGNDIQKMFEIMNRVKACSVLAVTHYAHPIWRALQIEPSGRMKYEWPEHRSTRTQDFQEMLHDAGQCYWLDVLRYRKDIRLVGDDTYPYLLPRWRAQDIDTDDDWDMAERLFAAAEKMNHE